jgi:hypothetical protein
MQPLLEISPPCNHGPRFARRDRASVRLRFLRSSVVRRQSSPSSSRAFANLTQ